MRINCFWLLFALTVSFHPSAMAQSANGAHPSPATPVPAKPKPAPPTDVKKYFVKIHTLLPFCVAPATDLSNSAVIAKLQSARRAAVPPAGQPPTCPAAAPLLLAPSNAVAIADSKALGSDADYELDAVGPDKIVIYLKTAKPPAASRLSSLEQAIDDLAGTDFKYAEVISVPAGTAKEMASKVRSLNSGGITASPLDGDNGSSILFKSKEDPNPTVLADLRQRIFDLRWQTAIAPPTQRLFHLNAQP
jgi:hypothetical protein